MLEFNIKKQELINYLLIGLTVGLQSTIIFVQMTHYLLSQVETIVDNCELKEYWINYTILMSDQIFLLKNILLKKK